MRVLVVDDEQASRTFTRDLLEQSGFQVTEAPDGAAAVDLVQHAMPDCIVLDLVMPGLSGFDTLRTLRKNHASLPPVVVLTGMDGGGMRTYATAVNRVSGFVVKAEIADPVRGLVPQVQRLMRA
jgi:CheY-like chemotaxis protein